MEFKSTLFDCNRLTLASRLPSHRSFVNALGLSLPALRVGARPENAPELTERADRPGPILPLPYHILRFSPSPTAGRPKCSNSRSSTSASSAAYAT